MICSDPAELTQYDQAHAIRVAALSYEIAMQMGLSPDLSEHIRIAGLLHDVGKNKVSRSTLNKPGKLTAKEFALVKEHCPLGSDLIRNFNQSDYPWLTPSLQAISSEVALYHHERLDGSGYYGLREISLPVRIIAVADVFDALTHDRPYRDGLSQQYGLSYLEAHASSADKQFDSSVILALRVVVRSNTHVQSHNLTIDADAI